MTKQRQWISIEEVATKYQIPAKRVYNWCNKQEITFSEIDGYLLLDENSLIDCIERGIRLSLSQEELEKRMEEKLLESKEKLFLLQSLKELTPTIRVLIKELAWLIRSDERRELFLFIALEEGSLKDYADRNHQSDREVQKVFEGLVFEIKRQAQFLRNYKEENIFLKARLRSYEINGRKEKVPERKRSEEEESNQIVISEKITALLNTSINELGFNIRAQRALVLTDMETLRHLLHFTHKYGFKKLQCLRQLGARSQANIEARLKELDILDAEGNCELYKYLF